MKAKDCFIKDVCSSYGNCQKCAVGIPLCKMYRKIKSLEKPEIIVSEYDGIYDFSFVLNNKFYRRKTDLKTGDDIYPEDKEARRIYEMILDDDLNIFENLKKEYPSARIICSFDGVIFDTKRHERGM